MSNNSATSTGTPPNGGPPLTSPPSTTTTPLLQSPSLTIDKVAGTPSSEVLGGVIPYTFLVTNTGNVTLTGIVVNDAQLDAPAVCPQTTLAPGASTTCTGSHTITQAEVDALLSVNTATASGLPPIGQTVTSPPDSTRTVLNTPNVVRIVKTTNTKQISIGGLIIYTLDITNTGSSAVVNATVLDTPPAGFTYVSGSAVFQDTDNAGGASGTAPITFTGLDIAIGQTARIRYMMRVSAGVPAGDYVNFAQAFKNSVPISNIASTSVRKIEGDDPLFEQSRIWGKVWDDKNSDGWQDEGEKGIPGVRVATVEGLVAETDSKGRYHFEGLTLSNMQRGQNFIVKVDISTLPEGSVLTTENPLLRRITPAVPTRFDFGFKLPPSVEAEPVEEVIVVQQPAQAVRLGSVYFDTDKTTIKQEFIIMLQEIAVQIEKGGTSTVLLTGFADKRASVAYNLDLAKRRAKAVYNEIARQLSPEAVSRLKVELDSEDAATGAKP